MPILQMKKLRRREVRSLPEGPQLVNERGQDSSPDNLTLGPSDHNQNSGEIMKRSGSSSLYLLFSQTLRMGCHLEETNGPRNQLWGHGGSSVCCLRIWGHFLGLCFPTYPMGSITLMLQEASHNQRERSWQGHEEGWGDDMWPQIAGSPQMAPSALAPGSNPRGFGGVRL